MTTGGLLTPPEVSSPRGGNCWPSDHAGEDASEGKKGQTSEQHFLPWVTSCVGRAKEGEEGGKEPGENT